MTRNWINTVYLFKAIPECLKNFTGIVSHFIRLKQKANADKRVAIYYFKGAGQSLLMSQGLQVPSLYNLIKRLKAEESRKPSRKN